MHKEATPFAAGFAQRPDQSRKQARARCADRVTQCCGAAVNVDLVVRQLQVGHGRHGYDGEGFVDLVQIDVFSGPAGFGEQLLNRAHRGGREPAGFLRMLGVADDARQWRCAKLLGGGFAHQHHGGSAVGNRR